MDTPASQANAMRVMRILWTALGAGPLVLLAVALVVRSQQADEPPTDPGTAFAFLAIVAALSVTLPALSFVMGKVAAKNSPNRDPAQATLTRVLVSMALCEGAALFAGVGYLALGEPKLLAGYAIPYVAMFLHRPTDALVADTAKLLGAPGTGTPGVKTLE